ncbi:hypothetical protein KY362_02465 [Candidatus Woesearchaeota archaeon]|nr:hypothetical protein [Candidatus Woesearchaeota archaeon]
MDFELRKATDLTGEFLAIDSVSSAASTGSVYGVYAVVALCALLIAVYVIEGAKKAQKMTGDSLSDINKKIDEIDRKFKGIK